MIFYKLQLSLLSPQGLEIINSFFFEGGGGGLDVASVYPASRIVVIPIDCEHTSILVDNMLLLRTLRYDFCKCSVIFEHRYVYIKRILRSSIIANIEVCFIQMQCIIEALMYIFKTF